jgi:hypothetical protein
MLEDDPDPRYDEAVVEALSGSVDGVILSIPSTSSTKTGVAPARVAARISV